MLDLKQADKFDTPLQRLTSEMTDEVMPLGAKDKNELINAVELKCCECSTNHKGPTPDVPDLLGKYCALCDRQKN